MRLPCRHAFSVYTTTTPTPLAKPAFADSYHKLISPYYLTSTHLSMYRAVPLLPDMRSLVINKALSAPMSKVSYLKQMQKKKQAPRARKDTTTIYLSNDEVECVVAQPARADGVGGSAVGGPRLKMSEQATESLAFWMQQPRPFHALHAMLSSARPIAPIVGTIERRPVGAPRGNRFENSGLNS